MNQRATEYNLNKEQLEQLIDKYITTIVDSMSMEDFQQYVRNDMWDYLSNATFSGVLNEIKYTLDDEMLDEFVKEIKNNSNELDLIIHTIISLLNDKQLDEVEDLIVNQYGD